MVTVIIGLGVSWLTKTDVKEVKNDLISPCILRFLKYVKNKTHYAAVEEKLSIEKEENEQ